MRRVQVGALLLVVAVVTAGCRACNQQPRPSDALRESKPTEVGVGTTAAVEASIGAAGGGVTSGDGRLTLTVPAGALSNTVTIAIEPITNTAHGGVGTAYRLTPIGQTFAKPVSLAFSFTQDDVAGSAVTALSAAYQDMEGYWVYLDDVTADAGASTLSAKTTHFTDFSLAQRFRLTPWRGSVNTGGSINLQVEWCGGGPRAAPCQALTQPEADRIGISFDWAVNGVSGGDAMNGRVAGDLASLFNAPAAVPVPATVAVSARFTLPSRAQTVLLVSQVTITGTAGYRGDLTFSVLGNVTGKGLVTWTPFEELPDVKRYFGHGSLDTMITGPRCDPVRATLEIESGTADNNVSTLVVYLENNSHVPSQYYFGITTKEKPLQFCCGNPRSCLDIPTSVTILVGVCPKMSISSLVPESYTDIDLLEGSYACHAPPTEAEWRFSRTSP